MMSTSFKEEGFVLGSLFGEPNRGVWYGTKGSH